MPSAYCLSGGGVTCADRGVGGASIPVLALWKRERPRLAREGDAVGKPSLAREGDAIGKPSSGPGACSDVTHSQEH